MAANLGLLAGSAIVEFLLSPGWFLLTLAMAGLASVVCVWGCWRVGRMFNLAHRPGLGNSILALIAGFGTFFGIMGLTTTIYARSVIDDLAGVGQIGVRAVLAGTPRVCDAVARLLPYVNRETRSNLTPDCATPGALAHVLAQQRPKMSETRGWIDSRIRMDQILILAAMLVVLVSCLGIPALSAYRSIALHGVNVRRSSLTGRGV